MLYYPQLASGSISQYPVKRTNRRRTIVNVLANGSDLRMEDSGAAQVGWDLSYAHVTTGEFASIQALFDAVEGRLNTFTFVDPTDNLLNWTEDFSQSNWTVDPLLQASAAVQDPFGGTGAAQMTNTAQVAQRIGQTIAAASSFQYCFSLYLRSDAPCTVQMVAVSLSDQSRRPFAVGSSWMRAIAPVRLPTPGDGIYFGLELPAGCSVTVFAPQVEAQPGAGSYKKTTNLAGVYPNSRFDSDELTLTATGPNQHSCTVRVTSCIEG
jgi:Conserved hypothetical protein 2217 (DUF2460)